uniref:Uncharacterized protein n=1 Tax=Oryza brachyantha TaxID=4533 RepID=J3MUS6_ORYBR
MCGVANCHASCHHQEPSPVWNLKVTRLAAGKAQPSSRDTSRCPEDEATGRQRPDAAKILLEKLSGLVTPVMRKEEGVSNSLFAKLVSLSLVGGAVDEADPGHLYCTLFLSPF